MAVKVRVQGGVRRNPRGRSPLVLLREDYARSSRPMKVDRDAGIIYGVKVIGLDSSNTHNVKGATEGTVYTPEALRKAIPLYEGAAVNINHPDRSKPKQDRSSYDRFGKLVNVRFDGDGLYADLHLLTSHPMAKRVMEAAEKMPDLFGLSHNAYGQGDVKNGRYVIHEIPEVRSVDLVADPGSNTSLFESREQRRPMKPINLRKLAESAQKCKSRKAAAKLLEMYEDEGDGMDDGAGDSLHDHLGNAILSILNAVKDGDMSPEEGRKKVLAAYKLSLNEEDDGEEEEEKKTEESEDDEGENSEDHDSESGTGDKEPTEGDLEKPKKAQESRRKRAPRGAAHLTEARAEALCELAGVEPAEELLESLQAIGDEEKAIKHLRFIKGLKGSQKPRTQLRESAGGGSDDHGGFYDVSRIKDGKSFAQLLRRGLN